MIERIIDHNMKILNEEDSIKPMSGNGTIALIYYPEFKQKNSYYCGPASALTAIYGMGKEGQVRGSTYTAKQDTLAANMGTINDGNGTYVYRMRNELNKYSTEVYDYFYEPSKSSMDNIIFGSLLSDNAPILHAQTEKIGYYNGHKTGHYITVVFANAAFGYSEIGGLAVMDNNPDNAYYVSHSISFNEAYNSIRGRYLIGVSL